LHFGGICRPDIIILNRHERSGLHEHVRSTSGRTEGHAGHSQTEWDEQADDTSNRSPHFGCPKRAKNFTDETPRQMIGVVLDTNIVVSANLSSDGLEALLVSLALNRKLGPSTLENFYP
jgi:hypothetical protein